jgi:hypothetical protein
MFETQYDKHDVNIGNLRKEKFCGFQEVAIRLVFANCESY